MSVISHDIAGGGLLLCFFLLVIGCSEMLIRRGSLSPESARKAIHLSGGLGCILFPFLITSWVTVLILASGFALILYTGESFKLLKSLSAVERSSHGALLFPVSILLLFVIAGDRLWLYLSALLVLVLADTAAALAGTRFGRVFYQTAPQERKSLEGTLAFFLAGLLAVFLPLWCLSDIPVLTCLLTALLMALLLAGLEAVSIGGTDNLFVPIGALYLLWKIPDKPIVEISFQVLSLLCIAVLIAVLNRSSHTLQVRPLIVLLLVTYAAWSLGSVDWMIPILVGFMVYNSVCRRCAPRPPDVSALHVLRPLYPSLVILFYANAQFELAFWQGPFLAATTVATSVCIADRFRHDAYGQQLRGLRLWATIVLPGLLTCLLCLPVQGGVVLSALPVLILLCAVATLVYRFLYEGFSRYEPWTYGATLCASTAALLYLVFQVSGLIPILEPTTWKEVFR